MSKGLFLALFIVCALVSSVRTTEAGCFTGLADCYSRASTIDSFLYRTLTALDCELDFIECTRIKLIGH